MGHPQIDNTTPFEFEPVFIADEEMRPVVVTLVKATYRINVDGALQLAEEQLPVSPSGEPWTEAPLSSYKYEPETALCKLATDVVLIGHAHPPRAGLAQVEVGLKVGPVQKMAKIFGDRYWVNAGNRIVTSKTAPLTRVPLTWENAFGGHDQARSTPECQVLEARNPVGTGFGTPLEKDGDRLKLPNIEDAAQLIGKYGAVTTPCGFGFTSPNWQPRAGFAGTYDEAWDKDRKPRLPVDFDRRFFSAAAPGLVAPGYLRGDEDVVVINAAPVPRLSFRLPGVQPPRCRVVLKGGQDTQVPLNLDTVIVNTDDLLVILFWRAYTPVGSGPHDVTAIEVAAAN